MAIAIEARTGAEPLVRRLARVPAADSVVIDWLGQAGFLLRAGGRRIVIDPYLSDTLADKYRGTATPHERMMEAPVAPAGLGPLDLVLVTHHHTDHMDPGTLAPFAAADPRLRFVVPRAARAEAVRRIGVGDDRLILLDAGDRFEPWPGCRITALRAAHESLDRDAAGHHCFLGYGLDLPLGPVGRATLVHSGDTIPFAGQIEELAALAPDLMLLPVNGRSAALAARGIAGNLTLDEAVDLTRRCGARAMVAHHHGMFAFNTLPLAVIEAAAARPDLPIRLLPAREDLEVTIRLA